MKKQYVFTDLDINKIIEWLDGAKKILDADSPLGIDGCKAAIDNALRELTWPDDERPI